MELSVQQWHVLSEYAVLAELESNSNGQSIAVPADELVPGDVVTLQSGDKVPAYLKQSSRQLS